MAEQDQSYRERLGDVLRSGDVGALRQFLVEAAQRYGDQGQVSDVAYRTVDELQELRHRMILARPDLRDLHAASNAALGIKKSNGPRRPVDSEAFNDDED